MGADLCVQVGNVTLYGPNAQNQLVGDLLVAAAVGNEPEHFDFASRKTGLPRSGNRLRWSRQVGEEAFNRTDTGRMFTKGRRAIDQR